jgi:hypothetical protein
MVLKYPASSALILKTAAAVSIAERMTRTPHSTDSRFKNSDDTDIRCRGQRADIPN